jgi:hypothetical protein
MPGAVVFRVCEFLVEDPLPPGIIFTARTLSACTSLWLGRYGTHRFHRYDCTTPSGFLSPPWLWRNRTSDMSFNDFSSFQLDIHAAPRESRLEWKSVWRGGSTWHPVYDTPPVYRQGDKQRELYISEFRVLLKPLFGNGTRVLGRRRRRQGPAMLQPAPARWHPVYRLPTSRVHRQGRPGVGLTLLIAYHWRFLSWSDL